MPELSRFLLCPMPGLLMTLHIKAGVVKSVEAAQGDSLAVDAVILEMA